MRWSSSLLLRLLQVEELCFVGDVLFAVSLGLGDVVGGEGSSTSMALELVFSSSALLSSFVS